MRTLARLTTALLIWIAGPGIAGYLRIKLMHRSAAGDFGPYYLIRDAVPLIPELWPLAILFVVLPLVGYRRRDAFFYFVPFFGWALFVKAAWRLAALRNPDRPRRAAAPA
ncbi:hypothetical protein EDD29_3520 [Actinocorallia herbida]|uniref:Uncharacterized protein n=2 Tax=Actinocorallia herbida TaxID=58109 RepID=A0A3N1CXJ2_9ACTN|nr:hypothetical protein EDD29_3520 [Actinocorallia herbida]